VAVDAAEGGALAGGSVEGVPHATAKPSTTVRTVRTTLMLVRRARRAFHTE
jgi:hypothetical protein